MHCDMHCHLDLLKNMTTIVQDFSNVRTGILAVGTTPNAYLKEYQMWRHIDNIHVALGFHPQLVGTGYDNWSLFESLVQQCHYIGEVGLDFSTNYISTKEKQVDYFEKILHSCNLYSHKIISIHSFKSISTILELLSSTANTNENTYILHWFTGSIMQMRKAIELGCYFSINPKMLTTKSGINLIQLIPPNRLLLETDAPFSVVLKNLKHLDSILQVMVNQISNLKGFDISQHLAENENFILRYR